MPEPIEECKHCDHYHDWPITCVECGTEFRANCSECSGQSPEPYGDPGDGLGSQGVCCDCGKEQES